jgi:Leucine-rich repeat (LRR) protein
VKRNLYTCRIENQTINDNEYSISTPSHLLVYGFSIANDKKVKFFPGDLAEKFSLLMAVQAFNCSLERIDAKVFKNLRKLKFVTLSRNEISTIDSNAFTDLFKLETLYLDNNNLEYVSSRLFSSLENLKSLNLCVNKIETLSPKTFHALRNLESLHLKDNNLQFLHKDLFATLGNLKNITLNNNNVEVIHANLFHHNINLEYVWINDNKIKFINSNSFETLSYLKFINLMDNICINNLYHNGSFDMMEETLEKNCLSNEYRLEKKVAAAYEKFKVLEKTCSETENGLEVKLKVSESKLLSEVLKSKQLEKKLDSCMDDRENDNEIVTTDSTVVNVVKNEE